MNLISFILSIPLPLRMGLLFLLGACLGAAINLGIYRLAYLRRRISPWSRIRGMKTRRGWFDRIPMVGWWHLRRESAIHGRGFWIRPMLIELCSGLGVAALYWWEIQRHSLFVPPLQPGIGLNDLDSMTILHSQFAVHLVLLVFLAIATFIDIDEQTIPDAVTIPGTLIALILAALCPAGALPSLDINLENPRFEDILTPLRFDFPGHAAIFLARFASLAVGIACFLDWCGALLPRHWRLRVGIAKAWRIMWRRIFARPEWRWVLPLAIVGCVAIAAAWLHGGQAWHGLLSALIGMTAGGAIIWTIRFVAGIVLKREAMGFGDVTLMCMIGAFFGWQAVLIVFFLSPFAGALVGILQLLLIRENVIPYGPFLCLGTLVVLLFWGPIWDYSSRMFEVPWLVPSAIAVCLPILVILLYGIRALRRVVIG